MASGKQLSFQHGEVSPTQHYKADAIAYAQGLRKLRNMYVKRGGGVTNRPGFEHVKVSQTQYQIPQKGMPQGIKGFTWWDPGSQEFVTIEYAYTLTGNGFYLNGSAPSVSSSFDYSGPAPHKLRFVPIKDKIFTTPPSSCNYSGSMERQNVALFMTSPTFLEVLDRFGGQYPSIGLTGSVVSTGISTGPWLPASYLVTYISEDGQEKVATEFKTTSYAGIGTACSPAIPHAQLSNKFTLTLLAARPDIKGFNFYRAAGAGGVGGAYFKMVGRVPYNGAATSVEFSDYGADDPAITPPLDNSMYRGATDPFTGYLDGVNCAAYYQQRLIMGMEPDITPTIKPGECLASAVGVPEQVKAPVIFSNTGAFKFSIPVKDGTPPVAFLAMERLIAFTQKGVYVIQGGEQGVLSPTSLNPALISEEGCSKLVEPKISGTRGYFLNAAHTKLMSIKFTVDGNLEVSEASKFSDHLIKKGVMELEVITGEEDQVFLATLDGDLVVATVTEEGIHGFSTYDTNGGYVESIFRGKAPKKYSKKYYGTTRPEPMHDVLMVHMIRNGVRVLERLNVRDDSHKQAEFFADSYVGFGRVLQEYAEQPGRYLQTSMNGTYLDALTQAQNAPLIRLQTATDWEAGSEIIFRCSDYLRDSGNVIPRVLHFFYLNDEGKEQVIRAHIDETVQVVSVGTGMDTFGTYGMADTYIYKGYFEESVPLVLRDSNSVTAWSKWLPAFNTLPATNYDGQDILEPVWNAACGGTSNPAPVTVVADGEILSSPLNPNKPTLYLTHSSGAVDPLDLGDYYCNGYIGVPIEAEAETLDIERGDGQTLTDSNKLISSFGAALLQTRGGFFGMPDIPLEDMAEAVFRTDGDITQQVTNKSGYHEIGIPAEWNMHGRVAVKNVDPVPMTILSVYPKGLAGN